MPQQQSGGWAIGRETNLVNKLDGTGLEALGDGTAREGTVNLSWSRRRLEITSVEPRNSDYASTEVVEFRREGEGSP